MTEINRNPDMCFACGAQNPIGLHLQFAMDNDICSTTFTAGVEHQGWEGYMHGGLISTLLDETMAQWLWLQNIKAMTAEITTRFSLPVPIGVPLKVEAWQVSSRRRLVELSAQITLPDGKVAVQASAKFLKV